MDEYYNEHFHSVHGAVNESRHVFIEQGLKKLMNPSFNIFEVGFGTGLNALLTLIHSNDAGIEVHYSAIDLYPLDEELIKQLNYPVLIPNADKDIFEKIHAVKWDIKQQITPSFTLRKIRQDILSYSFDEYYDLVYFDAFSPRIQPQLWTEVIFKKILSSMNENGILVTYSASGNVKRSMLAAGFHVERIKGPLFKRHMLRAIKIPSKDIHSV